MSNLLDKSIKAVLCFTVFLVPLFFLPATIWPVALSKQMLLAFLALFCLVLWIIKIIATGKMRLVWSKTHTMVSVFLLVCIASMFFSGTARNSFWGMNLETDSCLNILVFGLIFFLASNVLEDRKDGIKVFYSLLASAGVLALFSIIQIVLQKPIFPWDFTNSVIFNPMGATRALGLLFGACFSAILALLVSDKQAAKSKKTLLISLALLFFIPIFFINHWVAWLCICICLTVLMAEMSKTIGETFDSDQVKRFAPFLFLLVFSLVFVLIKPSLAGLFALPPEVTPTYGASIDIAVKTLKESFKNLLIGSGPATWGNQFALYRPIGMNLTDFWQASFNQGPAVFSTFLATTGILGAGLLLSIIGLFLYQGIKQVYVSRTDVDKQELCLFVPGLFLLLAWFFYPLNFTLGFLAFLMLGLFVPANVKKFSFSKSPQLAFFTMMLGVILIVGSIVGVYKIGQGYRAALIYAQGLKLVYAEEPNIDEAIIKVNQAGTLDQKDIYFRSLSELFLAKLNSILNDEGITQEEKQGLFQQLVSNIEMSANAGAELNPKNYQTWLHLAGIYEGLAMYGTENALEIAVSTYEKTRELSPQSPEIPLSLGRVYRTEAERNSMQLEELEKSEQQDAQQINALKQAIAQNLDLAQENLEKALELKINLTPAYYLLGETYELRGDKENALLHYGIVLELEPENEMIKEKINALTAE